MKVKLIIAACAVGICLLCHSLIVSVVILSCLVVGFLAAEYVEKRKINKQISELTEYITKVQDFCELPQMKDCSEGSMRILQSEIYKVVTILREQYALENRQKKYMSDMMSDISHQFKTPLTAVSLMTELLQGAEVTEEQRIEYASKIDAQINKMTWLIRNMLTLSQIEAGVLEMKFEQQSLKLILDDISDSLDVMAEMAEVDLTINISDEIFVTADRHWLREALSNIIKNCIEHTSAGGHVNVKAERNNLKVILTVEDDGEGIAPEYLPHIFERFYKAGNTSPNSVGIGLAMAKQIINSHNGRVEVTSEPDKGTKFTVTFWS